ncbi:MAG: hypothetical protein H0X13_19190 [Ramlibacter sp.]|nr:hypothetical protein [Ramlibacter sp.]
MNAVAQPPAARNWVALLRGFAAVSQAPGERCELCGQAIDASHDHLLDLESRRTLCACPACATRSERGAETGWRRIPTEVARLDAFRLTDAAWDSLMIPIGLAFFYASSAEGRIVAMYPGPAGAVESLLDLEAWNVLLEANPGLATLRPDVEALLVHRVGVARQYFRVPIDRCFALAGLIRTRWHGLSGGPAVQAAIERFFAELAPAASTSSPPAAVACDA